jgi:hypothetical protein
MEKEIIKGGLLDLPEDPNRFQVGAIITLPPLSELPEDFLFASPLPKLNDQKKSDFCPAEAGASISEPQEGVKLSPEWMFAVGKSIEGDVDGFGLNLQTICRVLTKKGSIEAKDAPYSLESGSSVSFLRQIDNWPDYLFDMAVVHKKGSYMQILPSDGSDQFDTIRRTMWKFRSEKCGIIFGVLWNWPLSQVIMENPPEYGSGHALAGIGWKTFGEKTYMYIQNSYGPEAGEQGRHYFSREVMNAFARRFGCFLFQYLPAEKVKSMIKYGG